MVLRTIGFWIFFITSFAHATVVRWLDEPTLAREATTIVRGKVVNMTPTRVQGFIVTDIRIETSRVLKGNVNKVVVVRQFGGKIGQEEWVVPGTSRYREGEEVIVFLSRGVSGELIEVGVGLGKYEIDRSSGAPMVRRRLGDVAVANVQNGVAKPVLTPTIPVAEAIARFEERILSYLSP